MTDAAVTVVIPCRNVRSLVGEAIASLEAEQQLIKKIICVDDGSDDGTGAEIELLAAQSAVAIDLITTEGLGACRARNAGLAKVDTEFCQFLDADDLLMAGKLDAQIRRLESGGGAAVSPYFLESLDGDRQHVDTVDDVWRGLITSQLGCTTSMLFRTDAVRGVDGWADELPSSQEYELLFRMMTCGFDVVGVKQARTVKRERPGAISSGPSVDRLCTFIELRRDIGEHLRLAGKATPVLESEISQTIFRRIQRIHDLDEVLGAELFAEYMPSDFVPAGSSLRARLYRTTFNRFGFVATERARRSVARLTGGSP